MAAAAFQRYIQCPVCLSDFVDPAILPCQHSYCRNCITGHVNASIGPSLCPECREPFSLADIRPNRVLRNITQSIRRRSMADPDNDLMCGEHDEKMKLFCETEQKLICVVCGLQGKHQGHTLKPVKEASEESKGKVKEVLRFLSKENEALEGTMVSQQAEISKCKERCAGLKTQISADFEAMCEFLRKREEELHTELEDKMEECVTAMQHNLTDIQAKAAESREMEQILQSAPQIPQPQYFLQWWQDKGFHVTEGMKEEQDGQTRLRSKVKDVVVIPDSLSMGPYETHMAYFVWKEMLQTIKPGPERVTIKDPGDSYLKLSPEGHSIRQADRTSLMYRHYNPSSSTIQIFQTGRHYCELEVGGKINWSIGVKLEMTKGSSFQPSEREIQLHLRKGNFVLSYDGVESSILGIDTGKPPRRIGLYLDCDGQQVSFYNADTMTLIRSCSFSFHQPLSITVCPGLYKKGKNSEPLTFYWHHG
ncbi:zinc-binding protein A33-like [Engraulis encrasicolus]|uniref:zinc-binding protein A33-like n=1 Tax=Engraulis encrasicolus TaxID=184585 RepID=UPI002FD114C1